MDGWRERKREKEREGGRKGGGRESEGGREGEREMLLTLRGFLALNFSISTKERMAP